MKSDQVQTVVMVLFLGATSLASSGCGAYMASTQPPFVDTAALEAGAGWSREAVIEKLGAPQSSVRNADGTRVELYEFYEEFERGDKLTGQATFDKDDRLASFRVLGVALTEPEPIHTWQPTYEGY